MTDRQATMVGNVIGYSAVVLVVSCVILIGKWKFDECKKVGHSTLYCIMCRH